MEESLKDLEKETKKRIEKMDKEFAEPPVIKTFPNDEKYNQMLVWDGIPFASKCEHHHVSFHGKVWVGLLILEKDRLIGMSKVPRIVEHFLNPSKPTLQERETMNILKAIKEAINPSGIIIVVKAEHECMTQRGIKARGTRNVTSAIDGMFYHSHLKQEFFELIKLKSD